MATITTRQQAEAMVAAIANNTASIYTEAHLARNEDGTLGVRAQLKEDFSRPDGGGQWVFLTDDGL